MKKLIPKKKKRHPVVRFLKYRILHIDDSPHRIALGLATGLFVAWTPVIGLHLFIVLGLVFLLRANKFVALTFVWVANIFTFFFILYPSYLVGWAILNQFHAKTPLPPEQAATMFKELFSLGNIFTAFYKSSFWIKLWELFTNIGAELWIGCFVMGGAIATGSYFLCYNLVKWHRRKSPHRRFVKHD